MLSCSRDWLCLLPLLAVMSRSRCNFSVVFWHNFWFVAACSIMRNPFNFYFSVVCSRWCWCWYRSTAPLALSAVSCDWVSFAWVWMCATHTRWFCFVYLLFFFTEFFFFPDNEIVFYANWERLVLTKHYSFISLFLFTQLLIIIILLQPPTEH